MSHKLSPAVAKALVSWASKEGHSGSTVSAVLGDMGLSYAEPYLSEAGIGKASGSVLEAAIPALIERARGIADDVVAIRAAAWVPDKGLMVVERPLNSPMASLKAAGAKKSPATWLMKKAGEGKTFLYKSGGLGPMDRRICCRLSAGGEFGQVDDDLVDKLN